MTENLTPTFILDWLETVPTVSLAEIAPDPSTAALFSEDMINGFVHHGALASPRIKALVPPVVKLFQRAWDHGIRRFVLSEDEHDPETPEFESYLPHCVVGSDESRTMPELSELPFADAFAVVEKNSLNPAIATGFDAWLEMNGDIRTAIVVGNCTDLCTYQLAMHLRMRANALNIQQFTVIVPIDAVNTFDVPESTSSTPGTPHPGDFFHHVFLYHMAQNGIRVVKSIS
jgi:nicotinamidase-related amidase